MRGKRAHYCPVSGRLPGALVTHHLSLVTALGHNCARAPVSSSCNHCSRDIGSYRGNESCSSSPGVACQILHLCPPALIGRLATGKHASRVSGFWPFREFIPRPHPRGCGDRIGEAIPLDESLHRFSSDILGLLVSYSLQDDEKDRPKMSS